MRARRKRRQLVRRVTILATVAIVAISLAIGVYLLSTSGGNPGVDSKIGQPVSSSDLASLYQLSLPPYGPAASSTMAKTVESYAGTPFVSNQKPVVVYVGGEFCPYCAIQRWSLIIAMTRFGNFTNLRYMASSTGEGDYATFTFTGSSYSSAYLVFQTYEAEDRNRQPLDTVPTNFSVAWKQAGSGFPFMNFGDRYVVPGSMIAQPGLLQGKDWAQIISGIRGGDAAGIQIQQSANLITALVCKLTNNSPASVCNSVPISSEVLGLAGPSQAGLLAYPHADQPNPPNYVGLPESYRKIAG